MNARSGQQPEVSVVIGVRDASRAVCRTIHSVLAQQRVGLECIVVDDGSRDETVQRLKALARTDSRLRLVRQSPAGLTRALINGCSEARAPLIARVDAGDRMLAGRLARQRDLLASHPGIAVLATALRLCGPRGEPLRTSDGPGAEACALTDLSAGFRAGAPEGLVGIGHMTVCFRRDAYRAAGGYRPAFRLAQDVDLWARMAEHGRIVRLDEVLTEARVGLAGLSTSHHVTQCRLRELAAAAIRARRAGVDEGPILALADRISHRALAAGGRRGCAAYFVASCLARDGELAAADRYYRIALRSDPANLRTLLAYARTRVRRALCGPAAR